MSDESQLQELYDLLIIGGGITGAGIALDAAQRGMRVLLVEKGDFASGTSSRSTKLIHGGLRYLRQLEFGLVRATGLERAVNHRLAPLRVYPRKMLLPLLKGGTLSPLTARVAIGLYDWLADVPTSDRLRLLNARETLKILPLLYPDRVRGGALYTEYQTDDARLTLDILKTAVQMGAEVRNYTEAVHPLWERRRKRLCGYRLRSVLTGAETEVNARVVVAAVGPWTDVLRRRHGYETPLLHLSRGIHIVVPAERLPLDVPVYMDVRRDPGRMIFCIPRRGTVYIGTTDTYFDGSPDQPDVPEEEIRYLLDAVNDQFRLDNPLEENAVISSWTGLRPLIRQEGRKSIEVSRKEEILTLEDGLILITGGKLTGWRLMARQATDACARILKRDFGRSFPACSTDRVTLADVGLNGYASRTDFIEAVRGWMKQLPEATEKVDDLAENYGLAAERIVNEAFALYEKDRSHPDPLLEAEVAYVIREEWARMPEDYFVRRSGKAYFRPDWVCQESPLVEGYFKKYAQKFQPRNFV
jgi:glycerol-3-phosphate dehydrogenase